MKKLVPVLASAVLILLFYGCSPSYYAPNAHHVPLLTHKGETIITAAASGGDEVNLGIELQGATAVSDHIGLMANFYHAWGSEPEHGSGYGSMLEAGAGYFKPFEKHFIFSAFAGGGLGNVKNYFDTEKTNHAKLGFSRAFIQPALGIKHRYIDLALSVRLVNLHYHSIAVSGSDTALNEIAEIAAKPNYFLWEPALTLRLGYEYIKLQTQLGLSFNATNPDFYQEKYNINMGLVLDLFPVKKKSKE